MNNHGLANNDFSDKYIDLAAERMGGRVIDYSNQWFARCSNLIQPHCPTYTAGVYVETGHHMDGWETQRQFGRHGHRYGDNLFDWCVIRLGLAGVVKGFNIDTRHFKGNAPQSVSVEAAIITDEVNINTQWQEILPVTPVTADSQNIIASDNDQAWTHLRLKIYPDGGVARFRVYGQACVRPEKYVPGELVDLVAVENGGISLASSDSFYGSAQNILMPGRGINMGDGWETRRRRDAGHDWTIIKLGAPGTIRKVLIDTAHYMGNYPDRFSLQASDQTINTFQPEDFHWEMIIEETKLQADREHLFINEILTEDDRQWSYVRLNIFPDGGVSRLRILGLPNWSEASLNFNDFLE